jgi:hypothetical protein
MAFLILNDYKRAIQTTELNAITSNDPSVRVLAELTAIDEIRAYLIQRYDMGQVFTDTTSYSSAIPYKGRTRIYLDATAYSASSTYAIGALTLQAGNVYRCSTAIIVAEAFTPAHWTLIGQQYDVFYADLPVPAFDPNIVYEIGDQVYWQDKVYEALKPSFVASHDDIIQAENWSNVPQGNPTPDDTKTPYKIWSAGVQYYFVGMLPTNPPATAWSSVTAYTKGTLVNYQGVNYTASDASTNVIPGTDYTKWISVTWIKGDNRNQMLLSMMLDMVIYELCKRISPNNVPIAREQKWTQALENLKAFARGSLTAEIPRIIPIKDTPVSFGGRTKRINDW